MRIAPPTALAVVRVAAALVLAIHGIARARLGIVDDFGVVLGQWGYPAGLGLAWTITIVEIAGGIALAAGLFVRSLALWFMVQLAAGIYLVHARAGWFVVGAGRNGAEFSALLIICLAAVALSTPDSTNLKRRLSV